MCRKYLDIFEWVQCYSCLSEGTMDNVRCELGYAQISLIEISTRFEATLV